MNWFIIIVLGTRILRKIYTYKVIQKIITVFLKENFLLVFTFQQGQIVHRTEVIDKSDKKNKKLTNKKRDKHTKVQTEKHRKSDE